MNVLSSRAKRSVSISALRRSSASHNKATISTAIWRDADIIIEKGKGKLEVQFDPEGKFVGEEKVKEKKEEKK